MRAIRRAAALNVLAHLAALGAAGLWLRGGSAALPIDERIAFFRDPFRVACWQVGWGMWILAAGGSVAFITVVASTLAPSARARGAAMSVIAAAAIDLFGDTLQAVLLPTLVAPEVPRWVYVSSEAVVSGIGTVCANGLYSIAVVLLTSSLGVRVGTLARVTAWVTLVLGLALAASAMVPSPWLLQGTAPATILAFCVWTVAVARDLGRGEEGAPPIAKPPIAKPAPVNRRS